LKIIMWTSTKQDLFQCDSKTQH